MQIILSQEQAEALIEFTKKLNVDDNLNVKSNLALELAKAIKENTLTAQRLAQIFDGVNFVGDVALIKGEKGDKGDKGDAPSKEELVKLIRPLIKQPKDGKTPSKEELLALIEPLLDNKIVDKKLEVKLTPREIKRRLKKVGVGIDDVSGLSDRLKKQDKAIVNVQNEVDDLQSDFKKIKKKTSVIVNANKNGASGSSTFKDLTDTPADYTGQAGKVATVNATEDGIEFKVPTDLDDKVKASATDPIAGYLDAKVDNTTIEVASEKLQVKTGVFADASHPHTASEITDFDTAVSSNVDVQANTAKVSADGSITTHNDVTVTSPADGQTLTWNATTGQWENKTPASGVTDHGLLTGLGDDDHLQYHTDARADTWFGTKTTDDLSEGATNLYYTDARVSANSDVSANTSARHTHANQTYLDSIDQNLSKTSNVLFNSVRVGDSTGSDLIIQTGTPTVAVGGSVTAAILKTAGTSSGAFHVGFEIPSNDTNDGFFITTDTDQDGVPDKVAVKINALGDVGIGTTSPTSLLHVSDTAGTADFKLEGAAASVVHSINSEYDINYTRASGIAYMDFRALPQDGTSAAMYRFGLSSGTTGANRVVLYEPSSTTVQTRFSSSGEASYINAAGGNLGVGTNAPDGSKLDVNGSLTLRAMTAPADPTIQSAKLYVDSTTSDLMCKISDGTTTKLVTIIDYSAA